jgi:hypothetical protein
MKTTIGAILATTLIAFAATRSGRLDPEAAIQTTAPPPISPTIPSAPQETTAPATLDERLGCGVLLVTIDEVLQRNPQLAAKFSKGDSARAAMVPMFRCWASAAEPCWTRPTPRA